MMLTCLTVSAADYVLDTPYWHAEFHPQRLGNMTRLLHKKTNTELVRTPPDETQFLALPVVWGVPLIFPPNRTPYGKFTFRGREYQMPVNEKGRPNNLHGILLNLPWECKLGENTADLILNYKKSADWPHDFSICIHYEFGKDIVKQTVTTTNNSPEDMPFFIGFHTTLSMPEGRTLRIPHPDWCFSLSETHRVPDGKKRPNPLPNGFFPGGSTPTELDDLFPMVADDDGLRGVEVKCPKEKTVFRYVPGPEWKYWMCWNYSGKRECFCAEPMSGMVNCFNHQDAPNSGFDFLKTGESRVMTAEFSIREL